MLVGLGVHIPQEGEKWTARSDNTRWDVRQGRKNGVGTKKKKKDSVREIAFLKNEWSDMSSSCGWMQGRVIYQFQCTFSFCNDVFSGNAGRESLHERKQKKT